MYGKSTSYSVMCEEFLTSVFLEEEVEGSLKLDQEDMISVSVSLKWKHPVFLCFLDLDTQRVKKNADFNGTTQNTSTFF